MRKAIFLDRDGTLIEDRGYIKLTSEVVFYEPTFTALAMLQKFYALFIVTNQSGVAKGLISRDEVVGINEYVVERLWQKGIKITDVYVCYHQRSDGCECIKPRPFFLRRAKESYDIDLNGSISIGDHPCDVELCRGAGGEGIYVMTGHGSKHINEVCEADIVVPDIGAAAEMIMSRNAATD